MSCPLWESYGVSVVNSLGKVTVRPRGFPIFTLLEEEPPAETEEEPPAAETEEEPPAETEEEPPAADTEEEPPAADTEEEPPAADTEEEPPAAETEEEPPIVTVGEIAGGAEVAETTAEPGTTEPPITCESDIDISHWCVSAKNITHLLMLWS